jgi:hypothetical protein
VARPISPIHAPIDVDGVGVIHPESADPPPVPPPTRISRLAALDSRVLAGTSRSLGPGGASAAYSNAVQKALIDEMAEQLRAGPGTYGAVATRELEKRGKLSEIGQWAAEIIAAFQGE